MGNSRAVAQKHYLQVTDEHFERANQADESFGAQIGARDEVSGQFSGPQASAPERTNANNCPVNYGAESEFPAECTDSLMGDTRLELVTPSLSTNP